MLANAVMLAIHNVHKYPARKKQQLSTTTTTTTFAHNGKYPKNWWNGKREANSRSSKWMIETVARFVPLLLWSNNVLHVQFVSGCVVLMARALARTHTHTPMCECEFVCSISHFITEQIEPLDSCFVPYFVLPLDRFPELVDKHVLLSLFALVLLLLLFPHFFFLLLLLLFPLRPQTVI